MINLYIFADRSYVISYQHSYSLNIIFYLSLIYFAIFVSLFLPVNYSSHETLTCSGNILFNRDDLNLRIFEQLISLHTINRTNGLASISFVSSL